MPTNSVVVGTGSYLPQNVITNDHFLQHAFYRKDGSLMQKEPKEITTKLQQISGIRERRYASTNEDSADLSATAGMAALADAKISKEDLDGIIVAHNAGNMKHGDTKPHTIPNLASIVKSRLGIRNPNCIAYDIIFGCPGWIEGMTQAHRMIAIGDAKNVLVIGVDILSRYVDDHDLDTMLFGDGAGAVVLQGQSSENQKGIICYQNYSHCTTEVDFLKMGPSYKVNGSEDIYIKMEGRQVYRYAVTHVPELVNNCLQKAGIPVEEVDHFLFHQANEKMIVAMAEKLFKMNGLKGDIQKVLPMIVQCTGNTSVATVPMLWDAIKQGELPNHTIKEGDTLVLASVGAGMHANCMIYKV